jgi:5-oxoprolinase (ATP-hydrolysing)
LVFPSPRFACLRQLSSELMPMVKIVPRGFTACVDAYLTPCIHQYLRTFQAGFDDHLFQRVKVNFMQVCPVKLI